MLEHLNTKSTKLIYTHTHTHTYILTNMKEIISVSIWEAQRIRDDINTNFNSR